MVIQVCLSLLHVEWPELLSTDRSKRLVAARMKITGALRTLTRLSYPEIAALMSRTHHAGIWNQQQRYAMLPEPERTRWIDQVQERLNGPQATHQG